MSENKSKDEINKRIAKNTLFLYGRMIVTLIISLFTTRLVLEELGVVDYGIYNVVGGVVLIMEFLRSSLSTSTQRYFSFYIGKGDHLLLRETYSMSVNIYVVIILILIALSESLGLWFVNNHLSFPYERKFAMNIVYQFSILTFVISLLNIPFHAMILAEEKMETYAYVSLIETILKLLAVSFLMILNVDKLILYSLFIFIISFAVSTFYFIYCKNKFKYAQYVVSKNKLLLNELLSFTKWNLFGGLAGISKGQGVNIILNIFFGPAVNAARGISYQISGAINLITTNINAAINPQIVKSYSNGEKDYMEMLIYRGSKISYFLTFVISLPILLNTETLIKLWLIRIPEKTIIFTKLIIFSVIIDSLSGTLMSAAQASGKIKIYQISISSIILTILPMSYYFFSNGFEPETVFYLGVLISIISFICRLIIVKRLVNLSILKYTKLVLTKIFLVTIFVLIINIPIVFESAGGSIINLISSILFSLASCSIIIYLIGLDSEEKLYVRKNIGILKNRILN